jgi:two-component system sensor histidine kinase BaeS
MKLKFRHKLFLAFLLSGLIIVVFMLLSGTYFAHRNFEEYVMKVEKERLDGLAEALGREFGGTRTWSAVVANWDHWLRMSFMRPGPPPGAGNVGRRSIAPPPVSTSPPAWKNAEEGKPPSFGEPPPPPPWLLPGPPEGPPPGTQAGPHPEMRHPLPDICLFDGEKTPLTEAQSLSADGYRLTSILVEGQLVGWLGSRKLEGAKHPLDVQFIRQQSQTFYATAAVALLLAVVVTFLLARHLLGPMEELARGARALSSRRFDTRIEIQSRDEFGQVVADFNAMAQAFERYEQMRGQWIADISHELRTPVAILRGEIEAIQDGVREITREAIESLHFEVVHLSRIVHDLHDLSMIESVTSQAEQTVVDPWHVLQETLKSFHARLESRGMRVEAEKSGSAPAAVLADADRLRQLFSNLIENALRYARPPGVLRISREVGDGWLSIHIEDSGPGVPEESLDRLFDRLYRVDKARSRVLGGSGLGLAICKSIVESFGGRIEASNGQQGGLRITVGFPAI